MAVPLFPGEFGDLERELSHLGGDVTFPPTPVFSFPATSPDAGGRVHGFVAIASWKAGLAVAALLIAITLALPDARQALADWIGFPGIRIEIGDRAGDPPPTVTSIGGSLLLGEAATLEGAASAVEFDLAVPGAGLEGVYPEVYLNTFKDAPVVSFLYPASNELPEVGDTGVGMLLMQIDAAGNTSMFMTKRASAESPPRPVTVDGAAGMWIQGGVLMIDAGDPFWTYQRRSGNVLVWERGGITYRMESNLPLDDAIAIAEYLEPIKGVPVSRVVLAGLVPATVTLLVIPQRAAGERRNLGRPRWIRWIRRSRKMRIFGNGRNTAPLPLAASAPSGMTFESLRSSSSSFPAGNLVAGTGVLVASTHFARRVGPLKETCSCSADLPSPQSYCSS